MNQAYPEKKTLRQRVSTIFRPSHSGNRLQKKSPLPRFEIQEPPPNSSSRPGTGGKSVGSSTYGENEKYFIQHGHTTTNGYLVNGLGRRSNDGHRNEQTGEIWDSTAMMHSLARQDSQNSEDIVFDFKQHVDLNRYSRDGAALISKLPPRIWNEIASYLTLPEISSLAFSSKPFHQMLGITSWLSLSLPEHRQEKLDFLILLDSTLPNHLLCFQCAIYHPRTNPGLEQLKATHLLDPVYKCPHDPPSMRLTTGNILPFPFIQLAIRATRFTPSHGLPLSSLSRRWTTRDSNWSHTSRYLLIKNHVFLRVVSSSFAEANLPPSAQRHLLYSPQDNYAPYFSVCAHWRDGELMNSCKCALSHIPAQPQGIVQQLKKGPSIQTSLPRSSAIVSLCGKCRPIRRCPECPTEYMIEIKRTEDRNDPMNRFKQSIVVTRWSDLGDGVSPLAKEWRACNGEEGEFDSFAVMGKRGLSGTFEAAVAGIAVPGQRIVSMNPGNVREGEEGDEWY
ncbi:hypothetical protein F5884DRAFT_764681 [Xylogone sp. PMI_703]|nr:hypothetical protein F5884DRAFT_764681 [Xylogone sp. PMI_703]